MIKSQESWCKIKINSNSGSRKGRREKRRERGEKQLFNARLVPVHLHFNMKRLIEFARSELANAIAWPGI
jgi:hypothetical protein